MKEEIDFFDLDKHQLDEEWINQPELYYVHSTNLTEAKRDYELSKSKLELVSAEIKMDIRKNPSNYGLDKVTEDAIKTALVLSNEYKEQDKATIESKYKVDSLQAIVDALDHRKKALENLVHLFGMNYFSTPKAKEVDRDRMDIVESRSIFSMKKRKEK